MKFLHLGDLHIGKRVNEFPMIEDQRYIFNQILEIAEKEQVDGAILAGDIYDKALPSGESVELFDMLLTRLSEMGLQVYGISGNHDSAERIGYGSRIMVHRGVHLSKSYGGELESIALNDDYGSLRIYLLPFIKPANVRRYDEDIEIGSYEDAVKSVLRRSSIGTDSRNILVAHQFVTYNGTEPERSDSEVVSVGGLDNIDASVFKQFDYVALGHIHRPQRIGRETIRYAGSPLKYSFSEVNHRKAVTIVDVRAKGDVQLKQIELIPQRDMKKIKGSIAELLSLDFYTKLNTNDYYHVTLTDEAVMDAIGKLRMVYPNIMRLEFERSESERAAELRVLEKMELSSTMEIFEEFYDMQNGRQMDESRKSIIRELLSEGRQV